MATVLEIRQGQIKRNKRKLIPFEHVIEFARPLKLKSVKEWRQYCRSGDKPDDIPSAPK